MALPTSSATTKLPSTVSRLRALGEKKPRLRYGFSTPWPAPGTLRLVLPFRRHWPAICISGLLLAVFSAPLVGILLQPGPQGDDLFSLVFSLFYLFWGLGWSVGVAILALVFLILLLGREVVVVRPDAILIRLELLGLGVGGEYEARGIGNLRTARPDSAGGTAWRGSHLAFDYYSIPVGFGSALVEPRASEILERIRGVIILPSEVGAVPAQNFAAVEDSAEAGRPSRTEPAPGLAPAAARPGIIAGEGWMTSLSTPSTLALLLANLVPLAGVWLLGWEIGEIMLLYWAESGVIGFFNLLKMAVVGRWSILFYGPFFVGHYGAFMAVHLLFVYAFFVEGLQARDGLALSGVAGHFITLWPALLALAISHGISFRINFLGRREFAWTTVQKQMGEPYGRIIIMHLTIIFGGFVVMGLGNSLPALLMLMGAKIVADLRAHARQHR